MRTCSAQLILALWCSTVTGAAAPAAVPAVAAINLADVVRAYRESPTPARRKAIATYAAGHPKEAALADFALGIALYEQRDYAAAIAALKPIPGRLPLIADYAAYYLAAARVESNDFNAIANDLAPAHHPAIASPLSGKAWILEARALKSTDASAAASLLREHYGDLPQPEGDLTLADCYQAAGDLPRAADSYQRVYYQYLTGDAANRSAAALLALKDSMGAAFPQPLPAQVLYRAGRLLDVQEYAKAVLEYQSLAGDRGAANGLEHDQARVRIGAADYLQGNTTLAWPYLRGLDLPASEADAERLYYVVECARRRSDDDEMLSTLQRLARQYPKSPWRLKALVSAANRFLLVNRPDRYVPLFQAAYEDFPTAPLAAGCHWKVAFHAYLHSLPGAGALLADHLRDFGKHFTAAAALYFLARTWEQEKDFDAARAAYQRLATDFENHYYAMLAREQLRRPEIKTAAPRAAAGKPVAREFPGGLKVSEAKPVPAETTLPTQSRIERSRLLRAAGLSDLADSELRFGSNTDGQASLLAMEMAGAADAPHQAMRIMKSMSPGYLNLPVAGAPRKFWELLFPLPYRTDVVSNAQQRGIDPYLLAGLIRQESEFNPQALSRAKAYGLTQVRPGTGRQFARRAGIPRFTTRLLYQPSANLKLGTSILRAMLDQNGGRLEETLAAYNAGPARVAEWLSWNTYREPAEFVESIPFTETRDYVQAVLRNAEMYRRLY